MSLIIDEEAAEAKSRLMLISLSSLTLRLMENWRRGFMEVTGDPPDYVSTMIIAAIVAVSGERLRRIGIESDYEALANELPAQALGKCNLTSISIATGLNRETVRRKVQRLEAQGILVKDGATRVRLSHDFVRSDTVIEMIQTQIETVQKTVSQLARDRVLVSPNDQA